MTDAPMPELLACHECSGSGLIGRRQGERHICNLCDGEGKFRDRRRPAPLASPEDARRVAEIAERCEKATEGPWRHSRPDMLSYRGSDGKQNSFVYPPEPNE